MTSLATAISGMKHWDWCPICRGALDTGLECDQCGADLMPIYTAFKESLSGGNPGEPKACTGAEERGISGATGAGRLPDGNPESTGDSADRRSPDGTERTPSPDESNRHPHEPTGWQPIETAPKKGKFMVWIPATDLAWPAYAAGDWIYSNSHGALNEMQDGRVLKATHWMPLPSAPVTKEGEKT